MARDHLQIEHTISLRGTSGAWLEITSRSTAASGAFPEEAEHVDKGNLYGEETHIICVCSPAGSGPRLLTHVNMLCRGGEVASMVARLKR